MNGNLARFGTKTPPDEPTSGGTGSLIGLVAVGGMPPPPPVARVVAVVTGGVWGTTVVEVVGAVALVDTPVAVVVLANVGDDVVVEIGGGTVVEVGGVRGRAARVNTTVVPIRTVLPIAGVVDTTSPGARREDGSLPPIR